MEAPRATAPALPAGILGVTPGFFRLHVRSPLPVFVGYPGGRHSPPTPICDSPCDEIIDVRGKRHLLIVDGKGILGSERLDLSAATGEVTLDVLPKPASYLYAGVPLFAGGYLTMGAGAMLALAGFYNPDTPDHGLEVAGLTTLGIGVAAFAVGMFLAFRETDVKIHRGRAGAARPRYWAGEF